MRQSRARPVMAKLPSCATWGSLRLARCHAAQTSARQSWFSFSISQKREMLASTGCIRRSARVERCASYQHPRFLVILCCWPGRNKGERCLETQRRSNIAAAGLGRSKFWLVRVALFQCPAQKTALLRCMALYRWQQQHGTMRSQLTSAL